MSIKRAAIQVTSPPPPPGASSGTLAITFVPQRLSNWCWAACCEMVFSLFAITRSQCSLASKQVGLQCCVPTPQPECNSPQWPETIYKAYDLPYVKYGTDLSLQRVRDEIDKGRPVEAYLEWTHGGAHVVLITGYYENGDLEVCDPLGRSSVRKAFSTLQTADGMGRWSASYADFGSRQAGV